MPLEIPLEGLLLLLLLLRRVPPQRCRSQANALHLHSSLGFKLCDCLRLAS